MAMLGFGDVRGMQNKLNNADNNTNFRNTRGALKYYGGKMVDVSALAAVIGIAVIGFIDIFCGGDKPNNNNGRNNNNQRRERRN